MANMVNAILVQSKTDWFWVEEPPSISLYERHEGTLSLTGLDDNDECTRIAQQYLATVAYPQTSINVGIEATQSYDMAYVNFLPGDVIAAPETDDDSTPFLVAELDVTHDDEGWAIPVPVLDSPKLDAWLRFQAQLKSKSGSLGGQASRAAPLQAEFDTVVNGKVPTQGPYTFSFSGVVTSGKATPATSPEVDVRVTQVTVKCPAESTDDSGHPGYIGTGDSTTFAVYHRIKGASGAATLLGIFGGAWPDVGHPGWVEMGPTDYEVNVYVGNEFISKIEELWAVCLSAGGHTDASVLVYCAPVL